MHNFYYEKIGNNVACIQDEIPFEIPESWTWCRLVNLFEIGSSKRVHKSDWRCSGVPFYRARDIEDLSNGFFKSELYIDKKFYEDCKAKYGVPEINDILISAVGTLGKVFVVRDKSPFYYKDGNIICLSNFSNTNPDFIKMLFASSFIEKQIHGGSHGVTVDTYTIIRANQTIIPLPSRSEQDRIVKVWEKCLKELATINNCKDEITKICGIIKTKILDSFFGENSSYKSYYEKRLKIKDICKVISSNKKEIKAKDVKEKGDYPVVSQSKKLIDGFSDDKDKLINTFPVVIFGDHTRVVKYVDFNFIAGADGTKILVANKTSSKYLYYSVLYAASIIDDRGYNRHFSLLKEVDVPLLDSEKEKNIVAIINDIFEKLNLLNTI